MTNNADSSSTQVAQAHSTVPMVLGTMYFGTTVSEQVAFRCLDTAYECGARVWDTANNYAFWVGGGTGDESETVLGAWLTARGPAVRDDVVLATKIGARPRPGTHDLSGKLGPSARAVREQLEASLRRLRTDRVELLYAHVDDLDTPLEETAGAMASLVDDGLVGEVAVSNLTPPRLREAVAAGRSAGRPSTALQQRFTYLVPAPEADLSPHVLLDEEVEQVCASAGMTMLGYSPLLGGAYTRHDRDLPDGYSAAVTTAALEQLGQVAQRAGLDAGQTVLAWMAQRERQVVPVVGVSRPEQVTSAWAAVTTALSAEDLASLDRARHGR